MIGETEVRGTGNSVEREEEATASVRQRFAHLAADWVGCLDSFVGLGVDGTGERKDNPAADTAAVRTSVGGLETGSETVGDSSASVGDDLEPETGWSFGGGFARTL